MVHLILFVIVAIVVFFGVEAGMSCGTSGGYDLPKKYMKYEVTDIKSFNEFCYPEKYELQAPQKFLGDFMSPKNVKKRKQKSILIFHRIGAGKTCTMIRIGMQWNKPLYLMPASLIPGFNDECRSPCSGTTFMTQKEKSHLASLKSGTPEHKREMERLDKKISKRFSVMSYNKFLQDPPTRDHPIILIDEYQNVCNSEGSFFRAIKSYIDSCRIKPVVVILSGTPIFDNVGELSAMFDILGIDVEPGYIPKPKEVEKLMDGYVSYYRGAPKYTYPRVNMKLVKLKMSKYQADNYIEYASAELNTSDENDAVYIKTRQASNIAAPPKPKKGGKAQSIFRNIGKYSCKMEALMKNITKYSKNLAFIYCSFTEVGGVNLVADCLEELGFVDYFEAGPGPKRYVKWVGDTSRYNKGEIKSVFNSDANDDGEMIQIVIGSPSIKEGVSLFRVNDVYVIETYWNNARLEQVYGRAIRYCSHKKLRRADREVNLYLYAAVTEFMKEGKYSPMESIDMYMYQKAQEKSKAAEPYLRAMKKAAVDNVLY